jgi:valyl-tRNA synthetase
MVRKELWTDDPETLDRRLAVYATLWNALRTVTLLFNPVTPFLSEALHEKVCRRLDPTLAESVNFESWPKTDEMLRDKRLEGNFETLFKCLSLVYAARQSAGLKRRWPLSRLILVASENALNALHGMEDMFVELGNVQAIKYVTEKPSEAEVDGWATADEGGVQVFLNTHRDERLLGAGLMRDLARRVQALRKELGYMSTDVLRAVYISELDDDSIGLLKSYLSEMKELVRAKDVHLLSRRGEEDVEWHESQLDEKKVSIAIQGEKTK